MFNRSVRSPVKSQTRIFPAPRRGWVRNESLAKPGNEGAEVLENFFPTPEGLRMRKGRDLHATIPTEVTWLSTYESGATQKLFGFDATTINDITTPADPAVPPTPSLQQFTSGAWSTERMATTGGEFLVCVNGADLMQIYDGTNWFPVTDEAIIQIAYDGGTGDFTVGQTVTDDTSAATAIIVGILNGTTATGTLLVTDVTGGGGFNDNDLLSDPLGGAAVQNGNDTTLSSVTITGIATSALSFVWKHKRRLWFVEGGTMSAWYLAADAIGGAATEFPLGGVFQRGGSLLFGGTWSLDSGDGLDDKIVFVTTEGEVAVYEGTDPSSTFSLVGVYRIGRPLSKNGWFRAGGDFAVLTDDGIVAISSALRSDRAALAGQAVTYPIEEEWRQIVKDRVDATNDFSVSLWHLETMLIVGVPSLDNVVGYALVANARTGAWTKYTNWDVRCSVIFNDELYFGTSTGAVMQGEVNGTDFGDVYTAVWLPRFETWGDPFEKEAIHARLVARANAEFLPQMFANVNYEVDVPTPLGVIPEADSALWGTGIWGTSVWGGLTDRKRALTRWQAVSGVGHALSAGVQISSGATLAPDIEVIAVHLQHNRGGIIV